MLRIFVVAWLLSPVVAMAITIDADTYFSYARLNGMGRSYFYIMLSKQACPSKDAPKGWKLAAYNYRSNWGDDPACWIAAEQDKVRVCPAGQYETKAIQRDYGTSVSPCHLVPKDEFTDTATLPRRSNF